MGGILSPPMNPRVVVKDPYMDGSWSNSVTLTFGVPQGSVLGPILFILYTIPLGDICRTNGITYLFYADDQQIYLSFKPDKTSANENCLDTLEGFIGEVRFWVGVNMMTKWEFIVLGYMPTAPQDK